MREIVINGRFLSRRITGVERYGREILSFIGDRCRVEGTRANGMNGHLWEQFVLPAKLTNSSVLWSPANTGPLLVQNQALTIHDLSPLEHPEDYKKSFSFWYRLVLPILAKQVRVVFTPSCYVQQKVMKRFGIENVIVVPNGVNTDRFFPGAQQRLREIPKRFILFVGSLQPRKNLQTLFSAWHKIKDEYPDLCLVIAGDRTTIFHPIQAIHQERVLYTGYIDDEDLPGLYTKAALFVLPSWEEGFGLPALEAMACGTPVIVSDGGALPEVVGQAALIFNRTDPDAFSSAIRTCLGHEDVRKSLVEKGFERIRQYRWQSSAELIWNTLHEI